MQHLLDLKARKCARACARSLGSRILSIKRFLALQQCFRVLELVRLRRVCAVSRRRRQGVIRSSRQLGLHAIESHALQPEVSEVQVVVIFSLAIPSLQTQSPRT